MARAGRFKAQAEVIGGAIVLTVLVVVMGLLLLSVGRLSSTSITGISRRAHFEAERSFESITVEVSDGVCYIVNTGSVPITIARLWSSEAPLDVPPGLQSNLTIPSAGRRSVDEIKEALRVSRVDYVVTARGNVFPVESACREKSQQNVVYVIGGGNPFTAQEILNPPKLIRGLEHRNIHVNTSTGTGTPSTRAVVYSYQGRWYCTNLTHFREIPSQSLDADLDDNGINELIVVNTASCDSASFTEWDPGRGFNGIVTFAFRQLLNITGEIDVLTVYFRVVLHATVGGNPHKVVVNPTVVIANQSTWLLSMPASTSTGGSRDDNMVVVFGTAVFPIRAFGHQIPPGVYDLLVVLRIRADPSVDLNKVRLEYIAVVGAGYSVYWTS